MRDLKAVVGYLPNSPFAGAADLLSMLDHEAEKERRQAESIVINYHSFLDYTDPLYSYYVPGSPGPRREPTKAELIKNRKKKKAAKQARKRNRKS